MEKGSRFNAVILYIKAIRIEYYVAYYFFVFMVLTLPSVVSYFRIDVRLPLILVTITGAGSYAMMVNNYYDYLIDKNNPTKKHLAYFVELYGKKKILFLCIINLTIFVVPSMLIAYTTKRLILALLALLGALLGFTYSAEPIRLKRRGLWGLISKFLLIFVLQTLYIFFSYKEALTIFDWLFVISASIFWTGATVVPSEAEDTVFDKSYGISTFALWIGPERSAVVMLVLSFVGGVGILVYYLLQTAYWAFIGLLVGFLIILSIMIRGTLLIRNLAFDQQVKWFVNKSPLFWSLSVGSMLIGNLLEISIRGLQL